MTSTHTDLPAPGTGVSMDAAPAKTDVGRPLEAASTIPTALGAAIRADRRLWLVGGAIVAGGLLLAAGVSASALLTFGILGACLGMHLFMGHGGHGGMPGGEGHPGPAEHAGEADRPGPAGHVHPAHEAD